MRRWQLVPCCPESLTPFPSPAMDGEVEVIRMLKSAKDSAVKACTQAVNQMKALVHGPGRTS